MSVGLRFVTSPAWCGLVIGLGESKKKSRNAKFVVLTVIDESRTDEKT